MKEEYDLPEDLFEMVKKVSAMTRYAKFMAKFGTYRRSKRAFFENSAMYDKTLEKIYKLYPEVKEGNWTVYRNERKLRRTP